MKKYNTEKSRAEFLVKYFEIYLKKNILDVGSGGSPAILKKIYKEKYTSLDIAETRYEPDIFADFENEKLPVKDNSYNVVLCMDCLEHIENIHGLFDELLRVSSKYVIISLPNNWPNFIRSFFKGRNFTHRAGYGLKPNPDLPGFRHKWFFNLQEAQEFILKRSEINKAKVKKILHIYEHGTESLFNFFNYSLILRIQPFHIKKIFDGEIGPVMNKYIRILSIIKKIGYKNSLFILKIVKIFFAYPLFYFDEIFKILIWGWGSKFRYLNMFCRQIWVVLEK